MIRLIRRYLCRTFPFHLHSLDEIAWNLEGYQVTRCKWCGTYYARHHDTDEIRTLEVGA